MHAVVAPFLSPPPSVDGTSCIPLPSIWAHLLVHSQYAVRAYRLCSTSRSLSSFFSLPPSISLARAFFHRCTRPRRRVGRARLYIKTPAAEPGSEYSAKRARRPKTVQLRNKHYARHTTSAWYAWTRRKSVGPKTSDRHFYRAFTCPVLEQVLVPANKFKYYLYSFLFIHFLNISVNLI